FPTRNVGLELAAILMIFTAQAWNLALSFYNSLKALPQPLRDACKVAGWPPGRTFRQLEVPAASQGRVWNGMLCMAGGSFIISVNEAFRFGDRDYRLPGIGSYMSVALDQGNAQAMALAIAAMVAMIVCVDQLLWRPLVVWVEKFRLDESSGGGPAPSSWVLDFLRRARLPRRAAVLQRRAYRRARRAARPFERPFRAVGPVILRGPRFAFGHRVARKIGAALVIAAVAAAAAQGAWRLWLLLAQLGWRDWGGRADGVGGPVVYPVQRDLRRGRGPRAVEGRRDGVSATASSALAVPVPAGRVPRAGDRVGDGRGRCLERLDRRGIHAGRRPAAGDQRPGEFDQRGHRPRQLPTARGGYRADEHDRRQLEPFGVALPHGVGADPLRTRDMTPGTVLLEAQHVTQRFRLPNGQNLEALRDVSLAVREHEVVALVGPSGCGKSTLLRLFAGLARPV